jgi:uncharacterized alkaline shock family protein YloU
MFIVKRGGVAMIFVENHIGKINISNKYMIDLIWDVVSDCYGVSDMSFSNLKESIKSILSKNEAQRKGVIINTKNNFLLIDLHITVVMGVKISAVVESVTSKVKYAVEEATGIKVKKVNVFIENIYI